MIFLIIILSFIFAFITFTTNSFITIQNPFVGYVFFQLNFLVEHVIFFIIGCIIIFFFLLRSHHKNTKQISYNFLYRSIFQVCALVITSEFLALVGLFLIAWFQLNSYALIMDLNPSILGVTTDTKTIVIKLQHTTIPPVIIPRDMSSQKQAAALAMTTAGSNFYSNIIIPAASNILIIPIKKFSSNFFFLENTLIVNRIDSDAQKISPILGFLFVQNYFPTRHIRSFPHIFVMNQKQFIASQENTDKEKLVTVATDIQKMEDGISSFSAQIQQDNDAITTAQQLTTTSMNQRNKEYDTCLSTGHYDNNIFIHTYTKEHCQTILDVWDVTLTQRGNDEKKVTAQLEKDQEQLKEYEYYDNFFKTQKTLMNITSAGIPDELGVFQAPNTIQIVATNSVADFFEDLCHEYLHYASYTPGKRFDSSFFEEGLTEYFARQVIADAMHETFHGAYPAQVIIITALTKRIAQPDLEQFYFTKDEIGLEKALNLAYGDTFYKDNYVYFESLQYTSDPQQIVQLTNTILHNMGEKPIQEKDLFQTSE